MTLSDTRHRNGRGIWLVLGTVALAAIGYRLVLLEKRLDQLARREPASPRPIMTESKTASPVRPAKFRPIRKPIEEEEVVLEDNPPSDSPTAAAESDEDEEIPPPS